jgi:chromosome segregation ATPase
VTSLTAIFGGTQEKPEEESDKLLSLYWNRAGLKKEFASLRSEQFRLQDCIKSQEGSTARIQQKLDHLERLLLDPEWVYNVVTHYQLQALNLRCKLKLEKFAEQLKQQREQKQNNHQLADWNEKRAGESAEIETQIADKRTQVQTLEDQLQFERQRLVSMSGLVRVFRRRSVMKTVDKLARTIDRIQLEEEQLLLRHDEVEKRRPPDAQGLDVPTKRLINCMILAFAQQLFLHFEPDGLAGMAKESGEKSVGAINYGSKKDSDRVIARVRKRAQSFEKESDFADILRQRAHSIAEKALYYNDDDAVPSSSTVTTVFAISEQGAVKTSDGDLLGENYWGLAGILSR